MSILKSDLLELERQNREIEHVQEYVKEQARSMQPVNFLKIWTSYKNYKKKLQEQKTTITELQVQLKLDGKPVISSDSGHRNIDIEDSSNEKRNVIDIAKRSVENHFVQKTTSFRSQLINRAAKSGLKEFHPFAANPYVQSSLVPMAPSKMPSSYGDPNKELRMGEGLMDKTDERNKVKKKIENLLYGFEKKLEGFQVDSIATEAVQRSLYGVFAKNYHTFKNNVVPSVLEDTFKKVFKGSAILNDVNRIILYFNLPLYNYGDIAIPKKIFPVSEDYSIKAMLEAFEKKGLTLRQPNVIVMKVDKDLIVGGYASHGWSISEKKRGDSNCFLFNLKQNFRFTSVPGQDYYQETISRDGIKFGDTDLVIQNDFKIVTSEIKGDYFVFGTHLLQNKLDSLIPDKKQFEPEMVEVWSFNE